MPRKCHSNHRCCSLSCPTCAWRYAGRLARKIIARKIIATNPRQLTAVEFNVALTPSAFRKWRIEARNVIDYRRRTSRWWRSLGLWGWRSKDGRLRGVVSLGSVTAPEFIGTFERRWPVTVRPIEIGTLRVEIYRAVRKCPEPEKGRYQGLKLSVWPRGVTRTALEGLPKGRERVIEPMPVVF